MLVEFTVENYRSFRKPVTLSMIASADDSLPRNVIPNAQGSGYDLLRAVGVFGANASGKSNLFWALQLLRSMVRDSARDKQADDPIDVQAFRFDPNTRDKPSRFTITFLMDGSTYEYSFAATRTEVTEESLFDVSRRRAILMERKGDRIKLGSSLEERSSLRNLTVRNNALWLSEAMQRGHKFSTRIGRVLFARHQALSADWRDDDVTLGMIRDGLVDQGQLLSMIRRADLNIDEINSSKVSAAESRRFRGYPAKVRKEIVSLLDKDAQREEVRFLHAAEIAGATHRVEFGFEDESLGTQKLFSIGGPIQHALQTGMTVYADEFDLRFHPLITEMLILQFLTPEKDTGAQLIFSSHSPLPLGGSLLGDGLADRGHDYLRRDQIVFVDKGPDAASDLYSLWDYKDVRKGEDRVGRYLKGRYRAVPQVALPSESGGKP